MIPGTAAVEGWPKMYMFHRLLSLVTMMYNEHDQLTMCCLVTTCSEKVIKLMSKVIKSHQRNGFGSFWVTSFASCSPHSPTSQPPRPRAEATSSAPSSAGRSNGTAPSATRTATARTARKTRTRRTRRPCQKPKQPRPEL